MFDDQSEIGRELTLFARPAAAVRMTARISSYPWLLHLACIVDEAVDPGAVRVGGGAVRAAQ